jgi:membrane protease YdiL (CAAX protease family)
VIYPAIGFGLWHLSPQSIFPHTGSGGKFGFAFSAIFLGLAFGWVAMSTGTILWVSVAHVLMDFAGMGGREYVQH